MPSLKVGHLGWFRKFMVITGISFLFVSVLMFIAVLLGLVEFSQFELLGHSGVRMIAAIAVAGCLLAATGFNDQ